MMTPRLSSIHKTILSLFLILLPLLAVSQDVIKGPRWYDEGKLSRRINIKNLTEGQEIPLFEQCLDGQFHVAIQLVYDIEGRQPIINWEYALNTELIQLQSGVNGYVMDSENPSQRLEESLLIGTSGANDEGLVKLQVSNNEQQTFVASSLYGKDKQYIQCNEEVAGNKIEYIVRVSDLPSGLDTIPANDIFLEFRLYEKPRYWTDYQGQEDAECYYLKTKVPASTSNNCLDKFQPIRLQVTEFQEDERMLATWDYAEGAWNYELEWIFISTEEFHVWGISGPLDVEHLFLAEYKVPIRIETNLQHYEITTTYPAGQLFFRVRGVGRYSETDPNQVTQGDWVYADNLDLLTEGFSRKINYQGKEHNIDLTWQAVTTFAEEGKSKKVVTYLDGSLRTRQVATDLNTDQHTLVAETYYDFEGRASINVLPVPDLSNSLTFRPLINRFQLTGEWEGVDPKSFYDNLNEGSISLTDESGAGKYYSPKNEVGGIHRDYIPDANGYAFTQVVFENDGMGRIKAQSGVGEQFKLKNSDGSFNPTTTRFFYSTPEQAELIRLFGKTTDNEGNEISLVGDALHFKKQLVVDPNGQVSVSYLDQGGQVRATGLYGGEPSNLHKLPTRDRDAGTILVDFSDRNRIEGDHSEIIKTITNADGINDFEFTYTLDETNSTEVAATNIYGDYTGSENPAFTLDAVYILEIEILDPNGKSIPIYLPANFNATSPNPDNAERKEDGSFGYDFGNKNGEVLTGKDLANNSHNFTFKAQFDQEGSYQVIKKLHLQDNAAFAIKIDVTESDAYAALKQSMTETVSTEIPLEGCDEFFEDETGDEDVSTEEVKTLEQAINGCENLLSQIQLEFDNQPVNEDGNKLNWETIEEHPAYCFYQACLANAPSKVFDSQLQHQYSGWEAASQAGLTTIDGILNNDPYFSQDLEGYAMRDAIKDNLLNITLTALKDDGSTIENTGNLVSLIDYENPANGLLNPATGKNLLYGDMTAEEVGKQQWRFFVSLYQMEKMKLEAEFRAAAKNDGGCGGYPSEEETALIFDPRPYLTTNALEVQSTNEEMLGNGDEEPYLTPDFEQQAHNALIYYLDNLAEGCVDIIQNTEANNYYDLLHGYLVSYLQAFPYRYTDEQGEQQTRQNIFGSIFSEDTELANAEIKNTGTITDANHPAYHLVSFINQLNASCNGAVVDHYAQAEYKLQDILSVLKPDCRNLILDSEGTSTDYYTQLLTTIEGYYVEYGDDNPSASIFPQDVAALTDGTNLTTHPARFLKQVLDILKDPNSGICTDTEFTWEFVQVLDPFECVTYETQQVVSDIGPLDAYKFITDSYNRTTYIHAKKKEVEPVFDGATFIEATVNMDLPATTNGSGKSSNPSYRLPILSHVGGGNALYGSREVLDFAFIQNNKGQRFLTLGYTETGNSTQYHSLQAQLPKNLDLTGCKTFALKYAPESKCINNTSNCTYSFDLTFFILDKDGNEIFSKKVSQNDHWIYKGPNNNAFLSELVIYENFATNPQKLIPATIQDIRIYRSDADQPLGLKNYNFDGTTYSITRALENEPTVTKVIAHWLITDPNDPNLSFHNNLGSNANIWLEGGSCINGLVYKDQEVCTQMRGEQGNGVFNGGGVGYELTDLLLEELAAECEARWETEVESIVNGNLEEKLQKIVARIQEQHRQEALANIKESFRYELAPKDYHFTLYYYDQAGNLVQTVPPEGVDVLTQAEQGAGQTTPEHRMKTRYSYNSLGQLVWQSTPDGGESNFWYDSKGRLRLSQNAQQRKEGKYSYTKHDAQGRILEVGQLERALDGSTINIAEKDARLDDLNFPSELAFALDERTITHYDDIDELPYLPATAMATAQAFAPENLRGRVAWTEVRDSKHALRMNAEDPYSPLMPNAMIYDYDIHGNVRKVLQASLVNRITEYDYDLISGNVHHVEFADEEKTDRFIHRYRYDADNRITSVETSTDGYIWFEDAHYQYYAHGPLARTELGEYKVQGLDYYYNLQSWIKGVNAAGQGTEKDLGHDGDENHARHRFSSRDAFAYNLGYFEGDYKPIGGSAINPDATHNWDAFKSDLKEHLPTGKYGLFNGNISLMATDLKHFGEQGMQMMAYQYDQLNRIRQAKSFKQSNGNWAQPTNNFAANYQYDANGNLMSLNRYNGKGELMDQLSYHYRTREIDGITEQINQLSHVYDWGQGQKNAVYDYTNRSYNNFSAPTAGSGSLSNKDFISQKAANYDYDEIGNLIKDESEGILSIDWTLHGKVKRVVKADRSSVSYQYDGTGNRLSKRVQKAGMPDALTLYFRDVTGSLLETYKIHHSKEKGESYLEKELSIYGHGRVGMYRSKQVVGGYLTKGVQEGHVTLGNRSYELTNQLGNVLTVITDQKDMALDAAGKPLTGKDGLIAYFKPHIVSANDYYPFGLGMEERKFEDEEYRYGFNGKEKDNDLFDSSYDFGARIYNASIGRFLSRDPKQRLHIWDSPYSFAANSPIHLIDRNGEAPDPVSIIVGTVLGAISEVMAQVGINYFDKKMSIKESFRNLDGTDILWAATLGGLSGIIDGGATKFVNFVSKSRNRKIIRLAAKLLYDTVIETVENIMKSQTNNLQENGELDLSLSSAGEAVAGALAEAGLGELFSFGKGLFRIEAKARKAGMKVNKANRRIAKIKEKIENINSEVKGRRKQERRVEKYNKTIDKLSTLKTEYSKMHKKYTILDNASKALLDGTGEAVGNKASDAFGGFVKTLPEITVNADKLPEQEKEKK